MHSYIHVYICTEPCISVYLYTYTLAYTHTFKATYMYVSLKIHIFNLVFPRFPYFWNFSIPLLLDFWIYGNPGIPIFLYIQKFLKYSNWETQRSENREMLKLCYFVQSLIHNSSSSAKSAQIQWTYLFFRLQMD